MQQSETSDVVTPATKEYGSNLAEMGTSLGASPINSNVDAERVLIVRIKAGERALFEELIRPYERGLYQVAWTLLRNHADAEEATQEALLKALTHIKSLSQEDKFRSWLFRILTNEARMRRRKDRAHLYTSVDEEIDIDVTSELLPKQYADWREIPSEVLERDELRQAIMKAIGGLPDHYRDVLVLRDMQHLNVDETAVALGISEASVKIRLHRARLHLRERLTPLLRKRSSDWLKFLKGRKPW